MDGWTSPHAERVIDPPGERSGGASAVAEHPARAADGSPDGVAAPRRGAPAPPAAPAPDGAPTRIARPTVELRDIELKDIVARYPRWRVWRSRRDNGRPGAWYAVRPPIPWREPRTIVAERLEELARALADLSDGDAASP